MKKIILWAAVAVSFATSATTINLSDVDVSAISNQSQTAPPKMQNVALGGSSIFFENFNQPDSLNPVMPAGWALFNNDGLSPDENVNFINDAWVVSNIFSTSNAENYAAYSTSWYEPNGASDDWMITPLISLSSDNSLSWVARAQDNSFPDGYEVYVSRTTQDVAGCQAGGRIFSIPAEMSDDTLRTINLDQQGFANENAYICFRNNSVNQFVLLIDDVKVFGNGTHDIKIDAIALPLEYTLIPNVLNVEVPLSLTVSNVGTEALNDVTYSAQILIDGVPVTWQGNGVVDEPIAAGSDITVDLPNFTATEPGVYDVIYKVTLNGVSDENPDDNQIRINNLAEVTTDIMSRDDNQFSGALGISAGNGGYLGNMFEFNNHVTLHGVYFVYKNNICDPNPPNDCSIDGESIQVDVFKIDNLSGLPDVMVASTEAHVVPTGLSDFTDPTVIFTAPLNLDPGQYVFAVAEPIRTTSTYHTVNVQLKTSESRFTPGTSWVNWPTIPNNQWDNVEDFGFNVTFLIRPLFLNTDVIYKAGFE